MNKKSTVEKFSLIDIKPHSTKLFSVKPEILDGAVYGLDQSEFTLEELGELIKKFLKKEVK